MLTYCYLPNKLLLHIMNTTLITIIGFTIIFAMTTLGASVVYLFKKDISHRANAIFLGFAAGIMIAASVWSLIIPSIEQSKASYGSLAWLPSAIGIIIGGLFLVFLDKVVPHFHIQTNEEEGPNINMHKTTKLFLAITIHNIPEGLAVGFAFGGAAVIGTDAAFISALGLAIGIAIQNFPEGAAVSLPMNTLIKNKNKSFLFGMASGAVEPVCAILGYFMASQIIGIQHWLLAFSAGAMLFVVAEDLIPSANLNENTHWGTWGILLGFVLMMILDIALE